VGVPVPAQDGSECELADCHTVCGIRKVSLTNFWLSTSELPASGRSTHWVLATLNQIGHCCCPLSPEAANVGVRSRVISSKVSTTLRVAAEVSVLRRVGASHRSSSSPGRFSDDAVNLAERWPVARLAEAVVHRPEQPPLVTGQRGLLVRHLRLFVMSQLRSAVAAVGPPETVHFRLVQNLRVRRCRAENLDAGCITDDRALLWPQNPT
jgi:hypothetical protein